MHPFHIMLGLFAVASLLGFIILMRWERRQFMQRGLAGSWLMVRLSTIPIVVATAALVLLPAGVTAGMEGLAVFYLMLLTAAPVFWFGSHWIIGRFARPPMRFGDSALIAGSPLIYFIALALIAHPLQSIAWSLLRLLGMA